MPYVKKKKKKKPNSTKTLIVSVVVPSVTVLPAFHFVHLKYNRQSSRIVLQKKTAKLFSAGGISIGIDSHEQSHSFVHGLGNQVGKIQRAASRTNAFPHTRLWACVELAGRSFPWNSHLRGRKVNFAADDVERSWQSRSPPLPLSSVTAILFRVKGWRKTPTSEQSLLPRWLQCHRGSLSPRKGSSIFPPITSVSYLL